MNRQKAHWKIPAAVLALLLAWRLWYARPVDIYTLSPEVRSPEGITIDVEELTSVGQKPRLCSRPFTPEDPEWEAVLSEIESLRFRRPPWNAVLQFIPERTTTGRSTHDGDHHIMFYLGRQRRGSLQVQFFIDEWMYHSPYSNRNLTLWVKNSRETGDALAEVFRPLLEPN